MCDFLRDFWRGQNGIEAGDRRAQVLGRKVRVAHHHCQRAMAKQVLDLGKAGTPLDGPASEGMPQVMEPEILQSSRLHSGLPVASEGVPTLCTEHEPIIGRVRCPACQDGVRRAVEGHFPAPA